VANLIPDQTRLPAALGEFGSKLGSLGILTSRQIEELAENIESGRWPAQARELASRLAYENWLTEFQARKILANRGNELIVGRHVIQDRIGGGAMGDVYRAEHQFMGRIVALKVIKPELMSSQKVVARFLREMRLAARMNHPNVVRAFDADKVGDVFYIAMEYFPGKSLGEMLKAGPLRIKDVIQYGAQAALGLGHAHDQGILHRDVKPSNLLLTEDRKTIKVLDLGLGMLIETDCEDPFRTVAGIAVGTIDYMSPEQATGRTLDGRSDLYSLASCMYHLMTGHCPFRHENAMLRLTMRVNGKPTPITEYLPDLPRRLVAVMDKMLATDPDDRFQSGEEASEALLSLLRQRSRSHVERSSGTERIGPDAAADQEKLSTEPSMNLSSANAFVSSAGEGADAPNGGSVANANDPREADEPSWIERNAQLALILGGVLWAVSVVAAFFAGASVR
jgi:serine/threonine-protein kinase